MMHNNRRKNDTREEKISFLPRHLMLYKSTISRHCLNRENFAELHFVPLGLTNEVKVYGHQSLSSVRP